jgi:hypothetical protein
LLLFELRISESSKERERLTSSPSFMVESSLWRYKLLDPLKTGGVQVTALSGVVVGDDVEDGLEEEGEGKFSPSRG